MSKEQPHILHKKFDDYTVKEINTIKRNKCLPCHYYKGVQKNISGRQIDLGILNECDYIGMEGHSRVCRPELCPHSPLGGGIKLCEEIDERYVNHTKYCRFCTHNNVDEKEEPCKTCLKCVTRIGTDYPINFVRR